MLNYLVKKRNQVLKTRKDYCQRTIVNWFNEIEKLKDDESESVATEESTYAVNI